MHRGQGRPETGWISRGNAKSAGTGDMPIPGLITSRRQPRPKKKAVPERQEPVFNVKELKAAAAAERARVHRKKEKDDRRERKRIRAEREREKDEEAPDRRSRSQSRRREPSPSSSSSDEGGGGESGRTEQEARQERRERAMEEEEERLRKETDERFRAAQEEREARQREEARLAEDKKKSDEKRHQDRKKKLKGAFATGDSDEEDEDAKRQRELAERFKKQKRSEALSAAAVSAVVPMQRPQSVSDVFLSGSAGSALSSGLASLETGPTAGNVDAVSIRAQLADPSASRNFSPGEVADKYKLLQEMKRKFRRSEFGGTGGEKESGERARRGRSRSRDRKRAQRSPSKDRSRYDSVWIKPGGR